MKGLCASVCACMYVCASVHMHLCMCLCTCVCVCVCSDRTCAGACAWQLADAVGKSTTVLSVLLANTQMDDACVEAFVDALKTNTTVMNINFETNYITSLGIVLIAKWLADNKTLLELRINNQRQVCSSEAEEALMVAMSTNDTLVPQAVALARAPCTVSDRMRRPNSNGSTWTFAARSRAR
jgi:hypothetical protein